MLLPSLSLLSQTLREWVTNAEIPFEVLPVCSDDTVRGKDSIVASTAEIGLPVTTDPAAIASFLDKHGPRVVFCTYQSSRQVAEAQSRDRAPRFDLVIADEAQRCAGSVTSKFATVLDANQILAKRRLFMTATPRWMTGKVRRPAQEADYEVASMDNESQFGPQFHRLTFREAIERHLLADYRVLVVGVDDAEYREYAEKGSFITRDGKTVTDARSLASTIGVARAMRNFDLTRIVSFHNRVTRARQFQAEFADTVAWMPTHCRPQGTMVCDYVSGKMPSGQRDVRLDRLRHIQAGERGLLSNARCLVEGVDVPTLDGVAFIDPRHSQVDIVQAVGRAIRKTDDDKVGTIVLPVFIDSDEEAEVVVATSAFMPVWHVLTTTVWPMS